MNKKFLSVVLFGALMAGSSVTFTGCIDNDEPAGITTLRGAKAELLKAKAAVQLATAAFKDAQTQEKLAKVAYQGLVNDSLSLRNKILALELERQQATTAVEVQQATMKLDSLKTQAEINASKMQENVLAQQLSYAQAEKAYEDAMKALELSKTYLSAAELHQLNVVQANLYNAKAYLYGGPLYEVDVDYVKGADDKNTYVVASSTLKQKDLEYTVSDKNAAKTKMEVAYETYQGIITSPESYISEDTLKSNLVDAQNVLGKVATELDLKQSALEALESSATMAEWNKLKAEYLKKRTDLQDSIANKNIEANKIVIENRDKAEALETAIKKVTGTDYTYPDAYKDGQIVQEADDNIKIAASDALKETLEDAETELNKLGGGYVSYAAAKNEFTVDLTKKVLALNVDAKNTTPSKDKTASGLTTKADWEDVTSKLMDDVVSFADQDNTEYAKMNKAIDEVIKELGEMSGTLTSTDKAAAQKQLDAAKDALDNTKTGAKALKTAGIKAWTDAKDLYAKAVAYKDEAKDKETAITAAKAFNAAIAAAEATYTEEEAAASGDADKIKAAAEKLGTAKATAYSTFATALAKYYTAVNTNLGSVTNNISLTVTLQGATPTLSTKTLLAWLTDDAKAGNFQAIIEDYYKDKSIYTSLKTDNSKDESFLTKSGLTIFFPEAKGDAEKIEGNKVTTVAANAFKVLNTSAAVQTDFVTKSKALYGNLGSYKVGDNEFGMEVAPTEAELKAEWEKANGDAGLYGKVWTAEKNVQTWTEAVAMADQYAAIITGLNDAKKTISEAKDAYMETESVKVKAVTDAQKACLEAIVTPIKALGIEKDEYICQQITDVITAVENSVIGDKEPTSTPDAGVTFADDAVIEKTTAYYAFINALKVEIEGTDGKGGLKKDVKTAQEAVLRAEKMLELFKAGNLKVQHVIEMAEAELAAAKSDYENKVTIFNYWTGKLEEMTKTLYSTSAE